MDPDKIKSSTSHVTFIPLLILYLTQHVNSEAAMCSVGAINNNNFIKPCYHACIAELIHTEKVFSVWTSDHCTPLSRTSQGLSHHSETVRIVTQIKTTFTECDTIRDLQ